MNLDIYFESMSEIFMKQNKAMDDTALLSKSSIQYWEKTKYALFYWGFPTLYS